MVFPKTIILAINTHGGIFCDEKKLENNMIPNYEYPTFDVPNNIKKLVIVNSVPYGISIDISFQEIEDYNNSISNNFNQNNIDINKINNKSIDKIIDQTIIDIKNKTFSYIRNNSNVNEKYLKSIKSNNIYKKSEFNSGNEIVNKMFSYKINENNYDLKNIKIINKEFYNIDLFDLIDKNINQNKNAYNTSLKNILNFLSNQNVENIIIFDFSCYKFLPSDKISQRMIRNFRREINNNKRKYEFI